MSDRREFISYVGFLVGAAVAARFTSGDAALASSIPSGSDVNDRDRFPYFSSHPVSYLRVKLTDDFWAPRQKVTYDVSLDWISAGHDKSGGLREFRKNPAHYIAQVDPDEIEHVKFLESMATVIGVRHDPAVAAFLESWAKPIISGQGPDGYLASAFPAGPARPDPEHRWEAVSWSHEDFYIGSYLESAIAYREATGSNLLYRSAVHAADNMAESLADGHHAYTSGHPEIEQALMRLYELSGDQRYVRLCGFLLDQRGRHSERASFGPYSQDHIPVREQRTIEGHAVRAAFLFNGVTHYVGATGDAEYKEATLAVWDDFVNKKMYLHGAGGNKSARNEGYRKNPYCIPPDDTYGESCAAFANFQWAHSLFRLTGDASYIDVAERILYNVFYASLALSGDKSFYCNVAQTEPPDFRAEFTPTQRSSKFAASCCPPNIVKLFNKVGGFIYSTDDDGVYVKHYCASVGEIPWRGGILKLVQETKYPWDGTIAMTVTTASPETFSIRLRVPGWTKSHRLSINQRKIEAPLQSGWLVVRRLWRSGDRVELSLPMEIQRVTMPDQFVQYRNLAALQRGPIVYCLEQQDVQDANPAPFPGALLGTFYLPSDAPISAEHRPDFLGGVTVLHGEVRQVDDQGGEKPVRAMWVPYGVWANREPGEMRIWVGARKAPLNALLGPELVTGESCVS
jgi:hypothetical protein